MGFRDENRRPGLTVKTVRYILIELPEELGRETMNHNHHSTAVCLLLLGVSFFIPWSAAPAEEAQAKSNQAAGAKAAGYSKEGADLCLQCHNEKSKFPVLPIFKTKHAQSADARTPFAGLQCEACHGPWSEHPNMLKFGSGSDLTAEKKNQVCLQCHEGSARIGWKGGAHANDDVACVACHRVHVERDPVLTVADQPEVCFTCHKKQRADSYKASVHPIRYDKMACSECHNTHGSLTAGLLIKPTLNETCYTCHAEKRGPFLWEHAPVAEDCSLCHRPHGSNHPALLNRRPPLLCQQCHSQASHPSLALTGAGLPGGGASGFLLAKSCLNCHSQVHGSNHPSGMDLMR